MKFWKRHMGAAAITAAAILGFAVQAASAHNKSFTATCTAGVVVNADSYNGDVRNTVTLTVDGTTVASVLSFGTSYHFPVSGVYKPTPATSPHVVHLVIVAGDGAQFGIDQTITIPACSTPATTVASTTTVPATTTTTKASTPSTSTTGPSTTTSPATSSPATTSSPSPSSAPTSPAATVPTASSRRAVVPTTAAPKCDDTGSTGACLPATGTSLTLALLGALVLAAGVLVVGMVKASARRAAAASSVRKP